MKKNRWQWLRWGGIVLAAVVLLFSGHKLYAYFKQAKSSERAVDALVDKAVAACTEAPQAAPPAEAPTPPLVVDFEALQKENPDIIAWLYCEDTVINYPVLQSTDNAYYLYRLADGSENSAGSLFADFRNAADFSDWNTIIYGHNMKNGSMFGTLSDYHEQAYYEAHPVWWLFTPEGAYRIELFAGYITAADAEAFSLLQTRAERDALAETARARSTFLSDLALNDEDRLITLSTCSYEFDTARYVLLGVLQKV